MTRNWYLSALLAGMGLTMAVLSGCESTSTKAPPSGLSSVQNSPPPQPVAPRSPAGMNGSTLPPQYPSSGAQGF